MIELKAVWHKYLTLEKVNHVPSMGKLFGAKTLRCYQLQNLTELHSKLSSLDVPKALETLGNEGLAEIYAKGPETFQQRFLADKHLPINWVCSK